MQIHVAPDVSAILTLGVLAVDGVRVVERDPQLDAALVKAETDARSNPPGHSGAGRPHTGTARSHHGRRVEDPTLGASAAVRTMYRRIGIDPTKTRPSSEALLRRVVRGDPLPRINSLVDICNWCSLAFQLPYGLYDLDQIAGEVELRLGREGEQYSGIRKDVVHLAGRLTLADATGPFGNPTSDSARTMVTLQTRRALLVVFTPKSIASCLPTVLVRTTERVITFCGGREMMRAIT